MIMISSERVVVRFATNYFFDFGLYFPKLSMLAVYFLIIPPHMKMLRWALYSVTAFTAGSALVTAMVITFWCGPDPSVNWSAGPAACSVFKSITIMRLSWSLCFASEALIFILPLLMLRHLKALLWREKAGVVVLFTLGAVTMIVSTDIWATTEFTISIMIAASTALRPLLRRPQRLRASHCGPPQPRTSSNGLSYRKFGTGGVKNRTTTRHDTHALEREQYANNSKIGLDDLSRTGIVSTEGTPARKTVTALASLKSGPIFEVGAAPAAQPWLALLIKK
ncbi:hypothetical protein DL768_007145 [Monosporascus sp. mg162]|nr:hypothetical protein DL768_007145 [Monosporascus sp. mg162]